MQKRKEISILFITHYSEMYGANKSMLQLILELKENYEVTPIVLLRLRGSLCDLLEQHGIKYIVSHFYWWVYEGKGLKKQLHSLVKQVRNVFRIKKILKDLNYHSIDLVYSNSITISIGFFICKKLKCKHVWQLRETLKAYKFRLSLGRTVSKYILKHKINSFIVISDFVKSSYEKLLPHQNVSMIYNGIQPEFPLRKLNVLKTKLNLCVVGILCDQKNQLDALKALDVLVNLKKLDNIHLHFIGDKREDYFALLTNFISDKKLWAFVTLHGHCNNIKEQLQFMNLGIVCARDEGFGRVTIEFMFNRMPVIASNSGANPELVKDGVFGEIYPIENSWILADKIEKYVRKPEILEITGKKVQEYALQNFSSKRNSDLIYSKIQAILNQ